MFVVCVLLQPLRQFVSVSGGGMSVSRGGTVGGTAHRREVKDLAVSKDVTLLLSASADSTLAVWNIDTDRQITTMNGHRDEVCRKSIFIYTEGRNFGVIWGL